MLLIAFPPVLSGAKPAMRTTLSFMLLSLTFLCGWLNADDRPPRDFSKWEKEIAGIETKDKEAGVNSAKVVFVGSSSIRLWDIKKSFPELDAVNHGFGGSTIADSVHFFDRLVAAFKPKIVVFYAGDNDLAAGLTPDQVHADFRAFAEKMHKELPETKLVYIAIKPSPSRAKLFDKQKAANELIRKSIQSESKHFVYVDVLKPMLDTDGKARPELFVQDMLHMNADGYALWTKLIEAEIR
jgi:lysophospholipase L1-like esterase